MSGPIRIFDTTLRDGEQSPGCSMNLHEKLALARQLEKLGVDVIEAGFPIASDGDFEAVNLAANITLGDPAAMRLEMHMNGSHASTTKNMHEHLLQKFPKTFGRCSPGVPMRLHPRKFPVSKLTKGHDGALSPFEEAASWPPDTTCPDPE